MSQSVAAPGSLADPGALSPAAPSGPSRVTLTLRWLRRISGIVPFAVYVTFGLLLPMVAVAVGAFQSNDGGFTFSNVSAATHGIYLKGFWQSIVLSVISAVIPGILGLIVAYAIFTAKRAQVLRQVAITAAGVFANFGGCRSPSSSSPPSAPAAWSASGSPASGSTRTRTASPCTR
jgi:putative spermidine/putrescine transport system permease protein